MKETDHDHGDQMTCTGCMIADGRMMFAVDPGKDCSIGAIVEVPLPWKEGDPAPPDATHLFDGLSKDG